MECIRIAILRLKFVGKVSRYAGTDCWYRGTGIDGFSEDSELHTCWRMIHSPNKPHSPHIVKDASTVGTLVPRYRGP